MARGSLSRDGKTVSHSQDGARLVDHAPMSPYKANCSVLNCRRSARLRQIASIYESEAANAVKFSSSLQQETNQSNSPSSPKQSYSGSSLSQFRHSTREDLKNAVEITDIEDESSANHTLSDLIKKWKIKKRKACKANGQVHDMQMHNNAHTEKPKEEDELEATIYSLKVKMAKTSSTGGKRRKCNQSSLHSSPVQEKTMEMRSSALVASINGLTAASVTEANSDEFTADCKVNLEHNIENLHGEMEAFTKQSLFSAENSEPSPSIKKETVDIDSSAEVTNNVSERELDCIRPTIFISNIMDPYAFDLIEQNRQCFSSSSRHNPESCEVFIDEAFNVKNEHLSDGSTDCKSMTPKVDLVAELKHQGNLSVEVLEKDGQKELQFEDSTLTDEYVLHLIAAKNSIEPFDSNSERFTCSIQNDGCCVGDGEISFSHKLFNKNIVSTVSEFKSSSCNVGSGIDSDASLSIENHNIFVGEMKNDNTVKNICLGAIRIQESLVTDSDRDCSTVSGNCGDPVNDFMEPTSNCSVNNQSQIGCNNPVYEDGQQAFATNDNCPDQRSYGCITKTNYLLDADEWSPRHDKTMPSSQTHHLNGRSEKQQQCSANIPDEPDTEKKMGEIIYDFPESEPLDKKNDGLLKAGSSMDASTDSLTSSSLYISNKVEAERQKTNIQTTVLHPTETKFSGSQHVDVYSPKKLLSNRKEMSPNSQGKLLQALNECGLDDVIELSNGINRLSFDKEATKRPLSSLVDYGETFLVTELKKPKTTNELLPQLTKGILKSPDIICCNTCCSKNSSIHTHANGAIVFSQRQMQDTESIATKLLEGLNTLKSIVQETLLSEELSSPSKYNVEEMRLATKRASKLEVTTKKWLAMMAKDCNRFCKIMGLVENKMAPTVTDVHKGRKKITFADEAGGMLCQVKVYEQQPVAFIVPKN